MLRIAPVPTFGGESSSFVYYGQKGRPRSQVARLEPAKRAAAFLLMDTVARRVCLHAGGDSRLDGEGVDSILNILRESCAPDASGHVCQQVARFLQFKR